MQPLVFSAAAMAELSELAQSPDEKERRVALPWYETPRAVSHRCTAEDGSQTSIRSAPSIRETLRVPRHLGGVNVVIVSSSVMQNAPAAPNRVETFLDPWKLHEMCSKEDPNPNDQSRSPAAAVAMEVDSPIGSWSEDGATTSLPESKRDGDGHVQSTVEVMNSSSQAAKEEFRKTVYRHFQDLQSRGLVPNEAAALAFKLASGAVEEPPDLTSLLDCLSKVKLTDGMGDAVHLIDATFSSLDALHMSFLPKHTIQKSEEESSKKCAEKVSAPALGVDFVSLRALYEAVLTLESQEVVDALMLSIDKLLAEMHLAIDALSSSSAAGGTRIARPILIILQNPLLMEPEHHRLLHKIWRLITSLPSPWQESLIRAFASSGRMEFEHMVAVIQQFVTIHLYEALQIDEAVEMATRVLALLDNANERSRIAKYTIFYNDAVNNDEFNIKEDFRRFKHPERYNFSFCKYPFIYDPSSKSRLLQMESEETMNEEFEGAILQSIFVEATCPYLVLTVRRSHLIQDTLEQIQDSTDLKKKLKVKFLGEEGVDEGGVQKEFFQLIVRDIFDPKYGMFTYDEQTRLYWFSSGDSMDLLFMEEYELIGVIIGLAIYNGHILEFRFPNVIYKKLMGKPVTFEDLVEVAPDLARGLSQLLSFEGDVESVFCRSFQVSVRDVFGTIKTVDLKEDGGNVMVTKENRQEYVDMYTKYYLEKSIEWPFQAFMKGFKRLCGGRVLQFFRPEELEQLICGSPYLDFEALERGTIYDYGYSKDSQVIRDFWQVVHSFSDEQKKRLLFFATGSDRAPIKGLANLPFVISRNGPDSDRLPTAHTCFNHLLLPEYCSADKLKERLLMAINDAEGFGLM
ncbi:hypothetical protein CBR_g29892 [Chara braunii]|uniref:HECT-type E3 ubiquitin transferase n=1 Tax=Chara braunii TaxID=69332 RepID=A0A388JWU4_CHABU|nr:hypothetical protein CBR_g29892 [Chara braunii]|eukprot:GBG62284.1 hypothetical protein CBR_g29892 [Chara braunii]